MSPDVYRHNEQYCREQARKPGTDREAWLTMAEQWAYLIRVHDVTGAPHDTTSTAGSTRPQQDAAPLLANNKRGDDGSA